MTTILWLSCTHYNLLSHYSEDKRVQAGLRHGASSKAAPRKEYPADHNPHCPRRQIYPAITKKGRGTHDPTALCYSVLSAPKLNCIPHSVQQLDP